MEPFDVPCLVSLESTDDRQEVMSARSEQRRGMEIGRPCSRLLRRLDRVTGLSDADRAAVSGLPMTIRYLSGGQGFARTGDVAEQCCLILDGYLYRQKGTGSGRRQILGIHVAGDLIDLQTLHLPRFDHDINAAGSAVVGVIPHSSFKGLLQASPVLNEAFWRESMVESSIFREWIVNLGQRSALARVAHIVCELTLRLRAVGLARDLVLNIPWKQSDLADAAGISTVHTNRVVQELRAVKAIAWGSGNLQILDWKLLCEIGDFSPDYLHLDEHAALIADAQRGAKDITDEPVGDGRAVCFGAEGGAQLH
jgi:CRP-like cAMP-binding protein